MAGPSAAAAYTFKALGCTALYRDDFGPNDLAISASGTSALVIGDSSIQKLEIRTNPARVLGTTTGAWGDRIVFHPNGTVAYAVDQDADRVVILNVAGNRPAVVRTFTLPGVHSTVNDVAVSPNGKFLYLATYSFVEGPSLTVYSLPTPTTPRRAALVKLEGSRVTLQVALAPSGRALAVSTSMGVALFDTTVPTRPRILVRSIPVPFSISAISFDRSGTQISVGGSTEARYALISVAARRVTAARTITDVANDGISAIDVSPDNKILYLATSSLDGKYSIHGLAISNGATLFRGRGLSFPHALGVSRAGPTRGRVLFTSSQSPLTMCGVQQSPN